MRTENIHYYDQERKQKPMILKVLEILLPESVKEGILFIWDIIGITMWAMFGVGTLHALDSLLEFGIKALTFAGLALTFYIKYKKVRDLKK